MSGIGNIIDALQAIVAATNVQKARTKAGWSIRDLNRHTGISASSLRQIESGARWPNESERQRLSRAFGVDFFPPTEPRP